MGNNTVSAWRFRNGVTCVVSVRFVLPASDSVNLASVLLALLSPHPFIFLEDVFYVLAFSLYQLYKCIKRMLLL